MTLTHPIFKYGAADDRLSGRVVGNMYAPATILGASPLHFFRYAYLPEGHAL
jgi:hypothetical protein